MKKVYMLLGMGLLSVPTYADGITDGISVAGDSINSYLPYVQSLGFVLSCVIGIVAAFEVYYAISNDTPRVRKKILTWGGSCLAMLCMTIALPKFFAYEESGLLAGGGSTVTGNGQFAGGDKWGTITTVIPGLNDPIWRPDERFPTGTLRPTVIPTRPSVITPTNP